MKHTDQLKVLRNARVYGPENLGLKDIIISSNRILGLMDPGEEITGLRFTERDLAESIVIPGFIDNHVHILGGGGGLGFESRAPELSAAQLLKGGITTVIGMLGFDSITKSMQGLIATAKSLNEQGVSAFVLTGSTLKHPVPTLTGCIENDVAFIQEIIGVGEISISELGYGYDSFGRGSQYIAEVATASILAGRLARKAGYLCLQVPPYYEQCLKPIIEMISKTKLPIGSFLPSHVNQTDEYLKDAIQWGLSGGWVDVGVNYSPKNNFSRAILPEKAVESLVKKGVSHDLILLSSDGNGAPPKEEKGEKSPTKINYMPVGSLFELWRQIVTEGMFPIETALKFVTSNPAKVSGLLGMKGFIRPGYDADLIVLDQNLGIEKVIVGGELVVDQSKVLKRGMFHNILTKGRIN